MTEDELIAEWLKTHKPKQLPKRGRKHFTAAELWRDRIETAKAERKARGKRIVRGLYRMLSTFSSENT